MASLPKKRWIFIICGFLAVVLILIAVLLILRSRESDWKQQIKTKSLTAQYPSKNLTPVPLTKEFLTASMDFGINFLNHEANVEQKKNVFISPASALFALGMTGNGADGETLREFEQVLGNGLSMEELSESYSTLLRQYKKIPSDKLVVADSIWLKAEEGSVLPSFLEANARYFGQDIYSAPSLNDAKEDINFWVSNQTNGLIPMLYRPDEDIDPSIFMILINTIYFHMGWENEFNQNSARTVNFYPTPGQEMAMSMMHCQETMKYLEHDGAVGFLKPYKGGEFCFLAILPPEGQTPEEYLQSLSGQKFLELLGHASQQEISLTMPKFQLEFETKLNNFLREAGMETAFGGGNFSRMCSTGGAQINYVIQKTYIELDEKGTKAAAVTAVAMDSGAAIDTIEITLDRPFLYAILDSKNNFPLFLGILNQP